MNVAGIERMYEGIAPAYERANRLFTLGLDKRWRRVAADTAADGGGERWVDLCCGTGDLARALIAAAGRRRGGAPAFLAGIDLSRPMIDEARRRAGTERAAWMIAEAGALPLAAGSVDLVTIGFALRNLCTAYGSLCPVFAEVRRVLAPGGRLVTVETSRPASRVVDGAMQLYARTAAAAAGRLVSGEAGPYRYLARSVADFHGPAAVEGMLFEAGFETVAWRTLTLGVVAVHVATVAGAVHGGETA
ncbi:MAG: ubiquinone/menaquinone biosynthesis methyltransferase [Candidatus Krumholzibacteriota bacterium]|nr:ubiquinone/menaquinone biosynthesis methyltransferase [Candidatus Krumholzibacteriota bacterium]